MIGDGVPGAPDFARLYAAPGSPLSPRMPRVFGLRPTPSLTPTVRADGNCSGGLCHPIVQRVADEVWMERFVACFEALARRLEERGSEATQITTCTAEEMALHLVIDAAEGATRATAA
jgi:hypothetical protein